MSIAVVARAGAVVLLVLQAACGGAAPTAVPGPREASRAFAPGVVDVTALVARPDGSLRVATRERGQVIDVSAAGRPGPPVAAVAVRADGQRGLLGLVVAPDGRTFASWTRPDGVLVVGQVDPGPERVVWEGPPSADLANGGHLAWRRGRLVLGVGDLQQGTRTDDPAAVNGKLLTLDPEGPPGQEPLVLSSGWNNPFAFTVLDDGAVWVADNAPGDTGERLARGDRPDPAPVLLAEGTAPAGIDHIGATDLVVCGFKSGRLVRYRLEGGRPREHRVLATDCRTSVAVMGDGRVVYAAADGLRVVRP